MSTRTTRTAAALVTAAALLVGLNGLSSPTQAAPSIRNAPAADLEVQSGGAVLRARPFGQIAADTPEYYTVKVPKSGNYHVSLTGFVNYSVNPTSMQCLVVDKQKILNMDFSGYYLAYFASSDNGFDYGINESIDVDLKKSRQILLACGADEAVDVLKPITVTFERNGKFKNLKTKPFTPPGPRSFKGLFGNLG